MAEAKTAWYCRTWTELHDLGSSKVVNSAFIWLVVIPILSRGVLALSAEYGKDVKLPLNFLAFYYAAFFFTIAAAVFNWKCPNVAKLAPTFGSFKASGHSALELKNWYHAMVPSPTEPKQRDGKLILQFLTNVRNSANLKDHECVDERTRIASARMLSEFWLITIPEERLPDAHNLAIEIANTQNTTARTIATLSYGLGFLFFGAVVCYNLHAVVVETIVHFTSKG